MKIKKKKTSNCIWVEVTQCQTEPCMDSLSVKNITWKNLHSMQRLPSRMYDHLTFNL